MDEPLLRLTDLLLKFRQVQRVIRLPETADGWENDAEHSYHLAMVCLYLIDLARLPLNKGTVLQLALAHDLVEAYAGDTYFHLGAEEHAAQKAREAAASKRIAEEFPDFPTLQASIREYEERQTEEARFVYAMDKLVPLLIIYRDGGRQWRELKVTLSMIVEGKRAKIALAPEVVPYFEAMIRRLEKEPDLLTPES